MDFGGGGGAADAAKEAAAIQAQAAMYAANLQKKMFEETRQDLGPWMKAGQGALGMQAGLLGVPGYQQIDPTATLRATPGYNWQMGQGVNAIDRSAAARGMAFSGPQLGALTQFGQGLADQTYQQYYNNLANMGGSGQNAAAKLGAFGQNMASNVGQLGMAGAQAQAQGIYNAYNANQMANQNMWQNILGLGGLGMGLYGSGALGGIGGALSGLFGGGGAGFGGVAADMGIAALAL